MRRSGWFAAALSLLATGACSVQREAVSRTGECLPFELAAMSPPAADPSGVVPDAYYFSFRTAAANVKLPPTPSPPAPGTFAQVLAVMAAHCAGCHLPAPDTLPAGACSTAPAGGVSLCAREAYD